MLRPIRKHLKYALLDRWRRVPHSPIAGLAPVLFNRFRCGGSISLVDIGAHRGDFTLSMRKLCGVSKAVLVEPIEDLAANLRQNPELSTYSIYNCVVSDCDGETEMNIFNHATYISSVLPLDTSISELSVLAKEEPKKVRRPARTLDSILAETDLGSIDLLKIDVQGLEHKVIAGARNALARTTCVFVEVSFRPLYQGSPVFGDIYEVMYQQGFMLTALEPGYATSAGELLQADALFVRS
jgi:FkbM family methyltransferase